jgi:hypothetical protein
MGEIKDLLRVDPVPALLACGNPAVEFFARRDLLQEKTRPVSRLWELPEVAKLLRRQREDGSWKYPGGNEEIRSRSDYDQLETYRMLGLLVEKYGLDRKHDAMTPAAEFLFSFQTAEGDFRGIYGNQYTPNYSAGIMELLIKAGYAKDPRITAGFDWLLAIRQDDGGWAIPLRTRGQKLNVFAMRTAPMEPDRARPFSWLATGVVLRAFAAHPRYRWRKEAKQAGELVLSRFFSKDNYPDRGSPDYWLKFAFPFWFTDLLSALDSLYRLGFSRERPGITRALAWFEENQQPDGLWDLKMLKTGDKELRIWLALAICRVFKRFQGTLE